MAADILKLQIYEAGDWSTVSVYNPTQNLLWYEKSTSATDILLGINSRSPLSMSFASSYDVSQFIVSLDDAMTTGSGTVILNNLRTTTTTTAGPTTTTTTDAVTTTTVAGPTTTSTTTTTTAGPPTVYYTLIRGGGANAPNATLNIYRYRNPTTSIVVQMQKTPVTNVQIGGALANDEYYVNLSTVSTAQNSVVVKENGNVIVFVLQNGPITSAPLTTFTAQQGKTYEIEVQAWPSGLNPYNNNTGTVTVN